MARVKEGQEVYYTNRKDPPGLTGTKGSMLSAKRKQVGLWCQPEPKVYKVFGTARPYSSDQGRWILTTGQEHPVLFVPTPVREIRLGQTKFCYSSRQMDYQCDGAYQRFQHLENGARTVRSSRSASATQQVPGQTKPHGPVSNNNTSSWELFSILNDKTKSLR